MRIEVDTDEISLRGPLPQLFTNRLIELKTTINIFITQRTIYRGEAGISYAHDNQQHTVNALINAAINTQAQGRGKWASLQL